MEGSGCFTWSFLLLQRLDIYKHTPLFPAFMSILSYGVGPLGADIDAITKYSHRIKSGANQRDYPESSVTQAL